MEDKKEYSIKCESCGAAPCGCGWIKSQIEEQENKPPEWAGYHYFYNGYVIWVLPNLASRTVKYIFYLGSKVIDTIEFSIDLLRQHVEPWVSDNKFIWELFELSQGNIDYILKETPEAEFIISRRRKEDEGRGVDDKLVREWLKTGKRPTSRPSTAPEPQSHRR